MPSSANAGIFSFVSSLFGSEVYEAPKRENNSQTMALLEVEGNIREKGATGGGDITIVGDAALLAEAGPSGVQGAIEEKSFSTHISTYVVKEGDTLSEIAKLFNVSVNTIMWSNDISRGGTIRPGQKLIILPVSGVQHTVVKGDTLKGLATKYGGDVADIVIYNNLDASTPLALGSLIIIPDGELPLPKGTAPKSGTTAKARGTNAAEYPGYYMRPLVAGVKTQGLHGYNGVDIADSTGMPVYASATGDVIISRSTGWNGGYGKYIVLSHGNGTQTVYAHLSATFISEGTRVTKGQVIGLVGNTGKSTGPHLHFEIRGAKNPF